MTSKPITVALRAGISLTGLILLPLAGCAVGPDFQKPAPPDVSTYTAQPLVPTVAIPGVAGGNAQNFTSTAISRPTGGPCFTPRRSTP